MTSDDRHANFDSPYRSTSSNSNSGRNPSLSAISTDTGSTSPYFEGLENPASRSHTALASTAGASAALYSPRLPGVSNGSLSPAPYSPGARSTSALKSPDSTTISGIPLQDFAADGSPPPPPVSHSWSRIDRWAEDNYPELFDQLGEPATVNDINEMEHRMDCSLPTDVRESIQVHDGQERGGVPTGIVFGAMLLDCEEVVDEWRQWQTVISEFLDTKSGMPNGRSAQAGGSSSQPPAQGRAALLSRQDAQPEGAVQKVYCHPGWIPLVRDWGGNNIGIDLAPGPNGRWGQVIMFGRDYDCKYVIARSWANFLANVADDLESSNWYVEEDSGELKLRELRTTRVEPSYLEIMRMRTDRKYGRRPPPQMQRRRTMPPQVATGNAPVGPRPGSISPGRGPASPMIGFSPVVSSSIERGPLPPPAQSLSPIHAPTAVRPLAKVLEEVQNITAADRGPASRRSLQSNREAPTPPPINTDAKKDDMDDLSDLINTPTAATIPSLDKEDSSDAKQDKKASVSDEVDSDDNDTSK